MCLLAISIHDFQWAVDTVVQADAAGQILYSTNSLRAPYTFSPSHGTTLLPHSLYRTALDYPEQMMDVPLMLTHAHFEFGFGVGIIDRAAQSVGVDGVAVLRELLSATNVSDACKALIHGQDFACDMLGAAIEWFPKDTAIAFIHTWVMGLLNVGDSVERKAIYEAYHTMFRKEFETYPEFLLLKIMGDEAFNCPNVLTAQSLAKSHQMPVYLGNFTLLAGCSQWIAPTDSDPLAYCHKNDRNICNEFTCHGDDIMTSLDTWARVQCANCQITPETKSLSQFMRGAMKSLSNANIDNDIGGWGSVNRGYKQRHLSDDLTNIDSQVPYGACEYFDQDVIID